MYTKGVIFDGMSDEEIGLIKGVFSGENKIPVEDTTEEDVYDLTMNIVKNKASTFYRRKVQREATLSIEKGCPGLNLKKIEKQKKDVAD